MAANPVAARMQALSLSSAAASSTPLQTFGAGLAAALPLHRRMSECDASADARRGPAISLRARRSLTRHERERREAGVGGGMLVRYDSHDDVTRQHVHSLASALEATALQMLPPPLPCSTASAAAARGASCAVAAPAIELGVGSCGLAALSL